MHFRCRLPTFWVGFFVDMKKKIKNILIDLWQCKATWKEKCYAIVCLSPVVWLGLFFWGEPNPEEHFVVCLFKRATGYACPGCGTTRAMRLFFNGHFVDALLMNPISWLLAFYSFYAFVRAIVDINTNKDTFFVNHPLRLPPWAIVFVIVFTIANWLWNIWKGN